MLFGEQNVDLGHVDRRTRACANSDMEVDGLRRGRDGIDGQTLTVASSGSLEWLLSSLPPKPNKTTDKDGGIGRCEHLAAPLNFVQ